MVSILFKSTNSFNNMNHQKSCVAVLKEPLASDLESHASCTSSPIASIPYNCVPKQLETYEPSQSLVCRPEAYYHQTSFKNDFFIGDDENLEKDSNLVPTTQYEEDTLYSNSVSNEPYTSLYRDIVSCTCQVSYALDHQQQPSYENEQEDAQDKTTSENESVEEYDDDEEGALADEEDCAEDEGEDSDSTSDYDREEMEPLLMGDNIAVVGITFIDKIEANTVVEMEESEEEEEEKVHRGVDEEVNKAEEEVQKEVEEAHKVEEDVDKGEEEEDKKKNKKEKETSIVYLIEQIQVPESKGSVYLVEDTTPDGDETLPLQVFFSNQQQQLAHDIQEIIMAIRQTGNEVEESSSGVAEEKGVGVEEECSIHQPVSTRDTCGRMTISALLGLFDDITETYSLKPSPPANISAPEHSLPSGNDDDDNDNDGNEHDNYQVETSSSIEENNMICNQKLYQVHEYKGTTFYSLPNSGTHTVKLSSLFKKPTIKLDEEDEEWRELADEAYEPASYDTLWDTVHRSDVLIDKLKMNPFLTLFLNRNTSYPLKVTNLPKAIQFKEVQNHFFDPNVLYIRYIRHYRCAYIVYRNYQQMIKAYRSKHLSLIDSHLIHCEISSMQKLERDFEMDQQRRLTCPQTISTKQYDTFIPNYHQIDQDFDRLEQAAIETGLN